MGLLLRVSMCEWDCCYFCLNVPPTVLALVLQLVVHDRNVHLKSQIHKGLLSLAQIMHRGCLDGGGGARL